MNLSIDTFKKIRNIMDDEDAVLVYSGEFDQEIIKSMLKYAEDKLEQSDVDNSARRKIFNVMVEMLQNIDKHQQRGVENIVKSIFVIIEKQEQYHLITGNPIKAELVDNVVEKIDKINSMDADQLKAYYKEMRLASRISDAGGAGLGFIDIARKSENKIATFTHELKEQAESRYFVLLATINKNKIIK